MSDLPEELQELLKRLGINPDADGVIDLSALMNQFMAMSQSTPNDLAWPQIKTEARRVLSSSGADPYPDSAAKHDFETAIDVADLWLDPIITFPRLTNTPALWTKAEWLEDTFEIWRQLITPVAKNLSKSGAGFADAMDDQVMLMRPLMETMAVSMMNTQIARGLGQLPNSVLLGTELGLPVTNRVVLLSGNIASITTGLPDVAKDLYIYLACQETARQRLFAATPWLGPQLLALVSHYAAGIQIDYDYVRNLAQQQMENIDLENLDMAAMTKASEELAEKMFTPLTTPEQQEILNRLESLLALVAGWVDEVVAKAVAPWLPNVSALNELVRRHRATATTPSLLKMIGIDVSAKRVRDAANLWAAVRNFKGDAAVCEAWSHPDLIPTPTDLADPLGYAQREDQRTPDEMDEELAKLLAENEAGEE